MRHIPLLLCLVLALSACLSTPIAPAGGPTGGSAQAGPSARLTPAQLDAVGREIWRNESGGTVAGLTSWNAGEGFASLGIGHFIWFPAGYSGQQFTESFPHLLDYLRRHGQHPPAWIQPGMDCPWNSRAEFEAARGGARMTELRQFLQATVAAQAAFIARRLDAALPQMLAATPEANRTRVRANFNALAQTPEGLFALIDYVNFKGEGTNPVERYNGQGWGLAQVLQAMTEPTIPAFSRAADQVLTLRVQNAPPARGEGRWLEGWRNRVYRYGSALR